jgi:molybdate transport system ATP-binding protein
MPAAEPVIAVENVTLIQGGRTLFDGLNWTLRDGECWAVVGPTGSGKTTFAELLLGRRHPPQGTVRWPLLDRLRAGGRAVDFPSQVIAHVTFKEESRLFSYAGHYYQQRYEFADAEEPLSLAQFLRTRSATDEEAAVIAARLGIGAQLQQPFITLSNGQTRRARLARALLSKPELLVLDDPYIGLDAAGRSDLTALLEGLVREGLRVVLICREDVVPARITNVFQCGATVAGEPPATASREPREFPAGPSTGPALVELNNVVVAYGERRILDGISWTVRAGERWAVVGPNGSGKTTLLSLLCGDHPQAYSNDVRLFGWRRGTGETIWDVKRNVGLASPEFHLYFTEPLTAERTVATGFFDTLTDRPTTSEQIARIRELFSAFGVTDLLGRRFRTLSTGEQRLVLVLRALVKRPPLVILDEPFQGFDAALVERGRAWLDRELGADQTLLFVTHDLRELPNCVDRVLRLEAGRIC